MTDRNQQTPEPALPRLTEVPEESPKLPYGLAIASFASGIAEAGIRECRQTIKVRQEPHPPCLKRNDRHKLLR